MEEDSSNDTDDVVVSLKQRIKESIINKGKR